MGGSTGALALVGLAVGTLFLVSGGTASANTKPKPAPNPNPPVTLPLANPPEYDANLPAILQATVDKELANDTDPSALLSFAQSLANYWPIAAAALRARAAALQTPNPPPPPVPNPPPPPPPVPNPTPPVIVNPPAPIILPNPPAPPPAPSGPNGTPGGGIIQPPSPYTPSGSYNPVTIPDIAGQTYYGTSQETKDVQGALNNWASTVGYTAAPFPLSVDGIYTEDGKESNTQDGVGAFQDWINATQSPTAPLKNDGLAGPDTQAWLGSYLPNASAGQVFSTDGGY